MDLFYFPHLAPDRATTHFALFRNVKNAGSLRNRIITASTMAGEAGELEREEVNFAFINASLVTSRLHLQTAVYQAVLAEAQGNLRTRTVHSEILWNLNPTNNITEAIRRYGVSHTSTSLLVVRIDAGTVSSEGIEAKVKRIIDGDLVSSSQLQDVTDWSTIKKYHKLAEEPSIKATSGTPAAEISVIDNIVISTVAVKSVMT